MGGNTKKCFKIITKIENIARKKNSGKSEIFEQAKIEINQNVKKYIFLTEINQFQLILMKYGKANKNVKTQISVYFHLIGPPL